MQKEERILDPACINCDAEQGVLFVQAPSKIYQNSPPKLPICLKCISNFLTENPGYHIVSDEKGNDLFNSKRYSKFQQIFRDDEGRFIPIEKTTKRIHGTKKDVWALRGDVRHFEKIKPDCQVCDIMHKCETAKTTNPVPVKNCMSFIKEGVQRNC